MASNTPASNGEASAAQPPMSGAVVDITEASFQKEVLERSLRVPIVLDFWAEWCGPCKQLGPVLERLATASGGAWILGRIDVDAQQRLAAMFQVQSIPMVVAVAGGQPLDAFAGALPEPQVKEWIDAVLKAAASMGVGDAAAAAPPPSDPRIAEAAGHIEQHKFDEANALFREILAEKPNDPVATAGLAEVALRQRLAHVIDPATVLADAEAHPDDVNRARLAADVLFAAGKAEQAFASLVDVVRRTRDEDRVTAREHLLELFSLLAPNDPTVQKARRDLANALF